MRMAKEGAEVATACAACHTPRVTGEAALAEDAPGVPCASCHNVEAIHDGKQGRPALKFAKGAMLLGPHDVAKGVIYAHGTGRAPDHMKSPDRLCLSCHREMKSKTGVSICSTGSEHAKTKGLLE